MGSLVEGDLVERLTERGIPIVDTTTRLKGRCADGGNDEFDIIAHNGEDDGRGRSQNPLRGCLKTSFFKIKHL